MVIGQPVLVLHGRANRARIVIIWIVFFYYVAIRRGSLQRMISKIIKIIFLVYSISCHCTHSFICVLYLSFLCLDISVLSLYGIFKKTFRHTRSHV